MGAQTSRKWASFLASLLSSSAAAAAGAAATAATTSPIAGAAAAAAAKRTAEEVLAEFLPAQQDALKEIQRISHEIHSILSGTDGRVRALQNAPALAAAEHVKYAIKHPEQAHTELEHARVKLFDGWAAASDSAQRAFAAQQLSAVFALKGALDDSYEWLERALPEVDNAVQDVARDVSVAINQLPMWASVRPGKVPNPLPEGSILIPGRMMSGRTELSRIIKEPSLPNVIVSLAQLMVDSIGFRAMCAHVGVGPVWPLRGENESPIWTKGDVSHPDKMEYLIEADGKRVHFSAGEPTLSRLSTVFNSISSTIFRVRAPVNESSRVRDPAIDHAVGDVFLVGNNIALGAWKPGRAVPMVWYRGSEAQRIPRILPVPAHEDKWYQTREVDTWAVSLRLFREPGLLEYKYVFKSRRSSLWIWENGPNRTCLYSSILDDKQPKDVWRTPEDNGPS